MNVCFITKYPPIQGGVSTRCYWLARNLAQRGHQVTVVTNAREVEAEYRLRLTDDDAAWYEPVFPDTGGKVIVKATTPVSRRMHHIPFANPFVTKLATVAREAIDEHDCTSIFSYYLEPYGVAAHLVSYWTDKPYIVRHAGSDLGRLMKHPELQGAYREVFRRAAFVSSRMREPLLAMGVQPERIWNSPGFPMPDIFSPAAAPLDLPTLIADVGATGPRPSAVSAGAAFDPSVPTVGIYGKVGVQKGSLDLLHALSALKRRGVPFNFVAVTQGLAMDEFVEHIETLNLTDRTWVLPFLPHWKIPGFIRACTCVCFLERDFPISFHAPTVAREILACGTCLVVSSEILQKQAFAADARHGENLFVTDPTNHDDLASQLEHVLRDPRRAAMVGEAGRALFLTHSGQYDLEAALDEWERHLSVQHARRAPRATAQVEAIESSREDSLASCLPLSRTALGEHWSTLIRQYCGPRSGLGAEYEDAVRCAEFLRTASLHGGPTWMDDLLRYEQAHNRLYADAAVADVCRAEGSPVGLDCQPEDPAFLELRPRQRPSVRVLTFEHDMAAVCGALHKRDVAVAASPKPTVLVFKPEANFVGQELIINVATAKLLQLCDGTRTVREVAELFATGDSATSGLHADAVTRDVARTVRQLAVKGIVSFIDGPLAVRERVEASAIQEVHQ